MDPASQAALVFLFVTMQIIIMTQTTVVFILIICRKSLRTIPNLYIASLSVSDFLVGAFFATSAIIAALEVDMSGGWCRFIISMELLSYTAGSISLLALSIDRYRAVCKARGYKPSAKSTVTVMGIVWIISILYCLRNLVRFETNDNRRAGVLSPIWCNTFLGEQTLDLHFRAVDFFLVFLIPGIAMSVLYTKVYIQLKKSFAIAPTSFVTRKKRATKMLIIQVCVYILSWLPIYLHDIIREIQQLTAHSETELNTAIGVEYVEVIFVLAHSIINPLVYAYYNTNFLRELTVLYRSMKYYVLPQNKISSLPISVSYDQNGEISIKTSYID